MFSQNFGKYANTGNFIGTTFTGSTLPSFDRISIADNMSCFINGVRVAGGQSIEMRNGVIYVNGKRHDPNAATAKDKDAYNHVTIKIVGNVQGSVKSDSGDVKIIGDAASASTMSGNLTVEGNISGSASTMSGNLSVFGSVGGSATSMSGNVSSATSSSTSNKKRHRE